VPFLHGSQARVYANGYDLSPYFSSISTSGESDTAETSTLGATAKTYIPGLRDATLSAEGYFDGEANAVDEALSTALGQDASVWTVLPQGDVIGSYGYGLSAILTSYEVNSPVDGVVDCSAEAQSKVGRERGIVLHVLAARNSSSNAASQNNSAASTNGGAAYLQVMGQTGSASNSTVKVQHSVDNSVWTDLVTFTVFNGRTAERRAITGTINQYTRASWTPAAGATITFAVLLSRAA